LHYTTMAAKTVVDDAQKVEKKEKKGEKKAKTGDEAKVKKTKKQKPVAASAFSLLADEKAVDPTLSSLFAAKVCIDLTTIRSLRLTLE